MTTAVLNASEVMQATGEKRYAVLEIYSAVQGEGQRIGVPSTVIRLGGCTVGCKWCDTKYSWKASVPADKRMTLDEIVAKVDDVTTHKTVFITGGEPLEHPTPMIVDLITALHRRGYHVTVETSGTGHDTFHINELLRQVPRGKRILWSVSPKLSSAQPHKPFPELWLWLENAVSFDHRIQFKFVVDVGQMDTQLEEIELHLMRLVLTTYHNGVHVILQPCTPVVQRPEMEVQLTVLNNLRKLQEEIVRRQFLGWLPENVTLQILPQLHAAIYGQRRLV